MKTLVSITLTEEEQELLLDLYRNRFPISLISIAGKIRRAQEDVWTDELLATPDMTPCGLCEAPRATHDEPDHGWQWFRSTGSGDPVKFPGPGTG